MIRVQRGVDYTPAHGSRFCLHVGTVAIFFGSCSTGRQDGRPTGAGPRLELFTPQVWFRWSWGYRGQRPYWPGQLVPQRKWGEP